MRTDISKGTTADEMVEALERYLDKHPNPIGQHLYEQSLKQRNRERSERLAAEYWMAQRQLMEGYYD